MINICLFCEHVFSRIDIVTKHVVEGHYITRIKCHECGAEFENSMTIERGPTRTFVKNGTSEEMAKQIAGGRNV
jgi:hypothetical protein